MPVMTYTHPDYVCRLDTLEQHQLATVHHVEAPCDDLERLMAMGVCAGQTIELIQRGDPLILKVFGSRVGVSARLAHRVWVIRCDKEDCPLLARDLHVHTDTQPAHHAEAAQ